MSKLVVLDCEAGRAMGCDTYCCRLIVRYERDEVVFTADGRTRKNCVDKDPQSGLCVHLERKTQRCGRWEARPRACREFDCNEDPRLQVVLKEGGFRSLVHLARTTPPPREEWKRVPSKPVSEDVES